MKNSKIIVISSITSLIMILIVLLAFSAFQTFMPKQEYAGVTTINNEYTEIYDENINGVVSVLNIQNNQVAGSGSGFIYKDALNKFYIATNAHVVAGSQSVEIVLANEQTVTGNVKGVDSKSDLAVIEIDQVADVAVLNLGNSDNLKIAEPVMAIGSPLGIDFSGTATTGIISGETRVMQVDTNGDRINDSAMELIQTDTAINPGNSGGPLFNMKGEVIGINSSKIAAVGIEGISFAIPINIAIPILDQLEQGQTIESFTLGITGVTVDEIKNSRLGSALRIPPNAENGIYVLSVVAGSLAEQLGIQQNDIITKINGEPINEVSDIQLIMNKVQKGETIEVSYYQNFREKTKSVKVR